MTRGMPFDPPENDVMDVLTETFGNVALASKKLGVTRQAVFAYLIRHPAVAQHRMAMIHTKKETHLDNADHVFDYCFSLLKDNPRLALDNAKFIVEKLGHIRGWGIKEEEKAPNQANLDITHELLNENKKLREKLESLQKDNANQALNELVNQAQELGLGYNAVD